jgi:transposase
MRHIREALKLVLQEGKSANQAAATLGLPPSTLKDCLSRFRASGLPLDVALELSDADLSGHLYPQVSRPRKTVDEPDVEAILIELKRPGVTIQLLWEEYRKAHPSGLGKTQFWQRLHDHRGMTNLVMRQDHKPGERVMVDYSGDGLSVTDPVTGEVHKKELFVMAWAMSGLFFAMAQDSQKSVDWSMGHVAAFEYFGCAPSVVTPDCLKSAVTKAHRYDPVLNRTYVEMCSHYGVVAVPARPHSPRDKGRVENTVRLVQ